MSNVSAVTIAVSLLAVGPSALSAEQQERLTSEDVVRPFTVDGTRMELRWALTRRTYDARDLFLTVHQGASEQGSYGEFNLYRSSWAPPEPIRYERTLRLETQARGVSHFLEPHLVWAVDADGDRRQVLVVTELVHGSAGERMFSLYEISGRGEAEPLEFEPAGSALGPRLAEGETVCGSGSHDFSRFPFRFSYAIDAVGQHPCRASRGTMAGEYKLVGERVSLGHADRQ